MTKLLYYDPNSPLSAIAEIVTRGEDDTGHWVVVDQTVCHVHGGGQPSDRGTLEGLPIREVRRVDREVRHYLDGIPPDVGSSVEMKVDAVRRRELSGWHTGGHLLAAAAEQTVPGLVVDRADQQPGAAWVSGVWTEKPDDMAVSEIQKVAREAIASDLPILVANGEKRLVTIGEFAAVPCGGTHLHGTGELVDLEIRRVRFKKGVLKISYSVTVR